MTAGFPRAVSWFATATQLLACCTRQEIAGQVGLPQQTIADVLPKIPKLETLLKSAKSAILHESDFTPQIYSIWNFPKATNAVRHPGNIPLPVDSNLRGHGQDARRHLSNTTEVLCPSSRPRTLTIISLAGLVARHGMLFAITPNSKETLMKIMAALFIVMFTFNVAQASDEEASPERVKQLARQKAYNKRIASDKEARRERVKQLAKLKAYNKKITTAWAAFTQQFVIRQRVPVYSGPYQIGSRIVQTPNYAAIQAYKARLDRMKWNAMSDQQKRDAALFAIARNTGVIAGNTGKIARDVEKIADNTGIIAGDIESATRQQAIDELTQTLWPKL